MFTGSCKGVKLDDIVVTLKKEQTDDENKKEYCAVELIPQMTRRRALRRPPRMRKQPSLMSQKQLQHSKKRFRH